MDIRFGLRMQDKVRRFMKTSRVCMDFGKYSDTGGLLFMIHIRENF